MSNKSVNSFFAGISNYVIPSQIIMPAIQRWRKPPEGTCLTYSYGHVLFRPEPWVADAECASFLISPGGRQFDRFGWLLEKALSSTHCKRIICWSEAGKKTFVEGLNSERFRHKVQVVYYSVPPKLFNKRYERQSKTKLLFVGSQLPIRSFEIYGGLELLEAFEVILRSYDVELTIRAKVPQNIKSKYASVSRIRIIDEIIPWNEMEKEFQNADIGVLPYHTTTPHTILDMMSYELPIVARNCWATPEYIQDNVTGLLIQPSQKVPYYYKKTCHPNFTSGEFRRAIDQPDRLVVEDLVKTLTMLIENPELRQRLGRAARYEVERNKFSLLVRNVKLGKIFDEASNIER